MIYFMKSSKEKKVNFLRKAIAFIKKSFIIQVNYPLAFFISIFNIILTVALFYFLAKLFGRQQNIYLERYKGDLFTFLLIGLAYSRILYTWLNCFADTYQGELHNGSLEIMLATPTGIFKVLFLSTLWYQLYALLHVLIYFTAGIIIFKAHISVSGYFLTSVIALISMIVFIGLGIISTALLIVFKRGNPLRDVLVVSSTFLGGIYFPIEILPQGLQKVSYLLPVTYSLRAIREVLINGRSINFIYKDLVILTAFAIIIFPLSLYMFKKAFRLAKIDGSLTHY